MKTIGILGGASPVATVEYYKLVNAGIQARLGGYNTGEIIIASMNFATVERMVREDRWAEGAVYLNAKAKSLERAGADFILCVANTMHKTADAWMEGVNVPLLHIVDPTGAAIQAATLTKVALLGTKPTMSAAFLRDRYTRKYGIEILVPSEAEQAYINTLIFTEFSQNRFTEEAKTGYLRIVDRLAEEGAQGVILGCTEIGLLINQADRPALPMFDSMVLHAEAAVGMALEEAGKNAGGSGN